MTKNLLLIFTRNPELGKVKTRLAADVGDKIALDIYTFLLQHTVAITQNLGVDKQVLYTTAVRNNDLWDPEIYEKRVQEGADLGQRMHIAFEQGFAAGYEHIIVIGSDLYDLDTQDLEHAFTQLEQHDYVLGPATDGGYYLLGMKQLNTAIFRHKKWGSPTVLQDTLQDLASQNVALLDPRNDVDYLEDIQGISDFDRFLAKDKPK